MRFSLRNRFLYLGLTAILFTMPVVAEDIVGYKGVKWGTSLKVTPSKLKSESLNCSGRLLFNNSDAVKIVIQETGLDNVRKRASPQGNIQKWTSC